MLRAEPSFINKSSPTGVTKLIPHSHDDLPPDRRLQTFPLGQERAADDEVARIGMLHLRGQVEQLVRTTVEDEPTRQRLLGAMQDLLYAEVSDLRRELESARQAAQTELEAHARSKAQLSSVRASESAARQQAHQLGLELNLIKASTLWRVCSRFRAVLLRLPSPLRRWLRRALKLAWWTATFWRMPARLRLFRQRGIAAAPAPRALRYVPGASGAEGRYELSEVHEYSYVPPRKPVDIDRQIAALAHETTFSLIVPVYNTPAGLLGKLVSSIEAQWYPCWELIMVNDNSSSEAVLAELAQFDDPRITIKHLSENKRISGATNEGIGLARGDYIVFVDHDDELTPDCLYELALRIAQDDPDFIYSDEDKIDASGRYVDPFFKPDWSPDTLMSTMYTCHVSCVRRSLVNEIGGLRSEYDGCQDWDFILRVTEKTAKIAHIPKVLYHWRIIPESVAADLNAKPYVIEAGKRAREAAMSRRGHVGIMQKVPELPGYFRAVYALQGNPLVSILIPSRNNGKVLRKCIDSIFRLTSYRHFEVVIIDNGSTDSDTLRYMDDCRAMRQVRVAVHDAPFNYSEINNLAADLSQGDLLVFLNDDTEVISPDWLSRMGGMAQLPHIGAVGAKLLYEGGQLVQHAGVLNLQDGPGHAMLRRSAHDPGHFCRNLIEFNWLAVTGACLMMEKKKFDSVGRFDESFPIAYNDIDLCLRTVEAGFFNVVCQDVHLIHYESLSRGQDHLDEVKLKRLREERARLYIKHPDYYMRDPFHNPNLPANDVYFGLA